MPCAGFISGTGPLAKLCRRRCIVLSKELKMEELGPRNENDLARNEIVIEISTGILGGVESAVGNLKNSRLAT